MEQSGHRNPISLVVRQAVDIFSKLGFEVAEGPEIETEHYNFDALNVPKDHPARDMWDTFWFKPREKGVLLRTHTSPVQIRFLEKNKPPVRIIAPGRTFRYEATDATHEAQFYQLEGLAIDKDINLAQMKSVLEDFFKEFLGREVTARFRPSFFPFVEPGVEVDISCFQCDGRDQGSDSARGFTRLLAGSDADSLHASSTTPCSVCKDTSWIEIMGAGMVHPKVLNGVGIDSRKWQGFAFGMGIERLAMLKYHINDIRLFNSGDLRFINQF